MVEKAVLLLFFLNTNGPATVQFETMAQCGAAEPIIVQHYKEMIGRPPISRCVALRIPDAPGKGAGSSQK